MIQFYFHYFHHLLGLIIIFLPRKVVGSSFQKFKTKITFEKKNQMIKIRISKEKRKEGGEERPPTWWPMENSELGGP
jgi:hypothetical protein